VGDFDPATGGGFSSGHPGIGKSGKKSAELIFLAGNIP